MAARPASRGNYRRFACLADFFPFVSFCFAAGLAAGLETLRGAFLADAAGFAARAPPAGFGLGLADMAFADLPCLAATRGFAAGFFPAGGVPLTAAAFPAAASAPGFGGAGVFPAASAALDGGAAVGLGAGGLGGLGGGLIPAYSRRTLVIC